MAKETSNHNIYAHDYFEMSDATKANISMQVNLGELLKKGFAKPLSDANLAELYKECKVYGDIC